MAPVFKIYDDNGDLMIQPGLVTNMGGVGANFTGNRNPIWEIETGSDNRRRHDVLASFYLQFSPIAGLDIRTNMQPRFYRNRRGKYIEMANAVTERTGISENDERFDYTWDNSIDYSKSFKQP
jgi:TonB-dependent starch-binding outer membrane protein SusC